MPRLNDNLDIERPALTAVGLNRFLIALNKFWQDLTRILNGGVSFGDGVSPDNLDGVWINVTTPGTANTDFTVNHNLGRLPVAYFVGKKSAACDIYDGTVAATATQLTLKATVINVDVRLFVV